MGDIVIVDGNNLAHRCRHAFSLTTPAGLDCSVTYGFLSVLKSYLEAFNTTACIVCWDGGIPKYRREAVEEYKANRTHGDMLEYQDFLRQLDEVHTLLRMMGILSVRRRGSEADDLMYHAAMMTHFHYDNVAVVSSDRDMYQVVNISNNVFVWNPDKKERRDKAWVENEYGIPSESYTHWRALQGDSSDNVAGVVGIGEKTATKLFQQFGSLVGITNAVHGDNPVGTITGKTGERIKLFGSHRLTMNVLVMVLAFDRTGARHALWQASKHFQTFDQKKFKLYLMSQAFISLAHPNYYDALRKLECPVMSTDMRIPLVLPRERKPVENELTEQESA